MRKNLQKDNSDLRGISLFDEALGNQSGVSSHHNNRANQNQVQQYYIPPVQQNASRQERTFLGMPVGNQPKPLNTESEGLYVFNGDENGHDAYVQNTRAVEEAFRVGATNFERNGDEYPQQRAGSRKLTGKKKLAIFAYLLIVVIIILLIVISSTNDSLADTKTGDVGVGVEISTIQNELFYTDKQALTFSDSVKEFDDITVDEEDEAVPTNWFDQLCDVVESVIGG